MTAIAFPPLATKAAPRGPGAVKASGLYDGPLSNLADDGSAADAELIVQQIQNEIDARNAQLRVVNDRLAEIERQTEREAEAAAQQARDAVMAELVPRQEEALAEGNDLVAEIDALMTAHDDWYSTLVARRAAEAARPA